MTTHPDIGVRRIPVPRASRELITLPHVDYEEAFLLDVGTPEERTAEQWARAVLEESPGTIRGTLVSGWSALGLKLDLVGAGPTVLGWRVWRSPVARTVWARVEPVHVRVVRQVLDAAQHRLRSGVTSPSSPSA